MWLGMITQASNASYGRICSVWTHSSAAIVHIKEVAPFSLLPQLGIEDNL